MSKLTERELDLIFNYYIGMDGVYLNGFHEQGSLRAFLQVYCDLDINPRSRSTHQYAREFAEILVSQTPEVQAKIIRVVLARFPPNPHRLPETRNALLHSKLTEVANRLESTTVLVDDVVPKSKSEVVHLALNDAEHQISRGSARSAVDRTHTALHAYLKELCDDASIKYGEDPGMPEFYKLVRQEHPALNRAGPRQQDIDSICRTLGNIVDKLGPIRNKTTPVHPQDKLIEEPEAILAINAARTLFHYLEDKRRPRGQSLLQKLFRRR